jgi:1,4-dihydroxy-2-naphthoate octaprenyltransferase
MKIKGAFDNMEQYNKLSVKAVVELAAPHTWPAAVFPVILGTALSMAFQKEFSIILFYSTLVVSVLLQCAVNTINDYADFIKGTDNEQNSDDPNDASIIYNQINPKAALWTGVVFIVAAALSGIPVFLIVGFWPLLYAGIGVVIIVLYSLGKPSISYLPAGELVSGVVMGGIITMACYYVQTGQNDFKMFYYALPLIISIGLIMMVNNTSDIERDKQSGRKTLPALTGRKTASLLLKSIIVLDFLITVHITFYHFRPGIFLLPLFILIFLRDAVPLMKSKIDSSVRRFSMTSIVRIHRTISIFYILMIIASMILEVL